MLRGRKLAAVSIAVATTISLAAVTVESADAAPAPVPTVDVHMRPHLLRLNNGTTQIHAGRTMFKVFTGLGDHVLQIARLHSGYTFAEANADFAKAFSGNVAAVRRLDSHITFYGGAETRPNHPGAFSTFLGTGRYVFTDQNGPAHVFVNVVGTAPAHQALTPRSGSIGMYTYGFGVTPNLPSSGWVRVFNQSDQPHFVVLQHVKSFVTPRMVRKALMSPTPPSWVLRATTTSGVLSPNRAQVWHYDLPAGKYLLACFWPDDDTGMPHAFMGMWKLVTLG
jgi:hypothetical protein